MTNRYLASALRLAPAIVGTGGAAALARAGSFLLFAFAARSMLPVEFAGLLFVVGTSQLLSSFANLGWSNLVTRMMPRLLTEDPALRQGFIVRSIQLPATATVVICIGLLVSSRLPTVSGDFALPLILTAAALPPVAACFLLRSYLVAIGKPVLGVFAGEAIPLVGASSLFWIISPGDLVTASLCFIAAHVFGVVVQLALLVPYVREFMAGAERRFATSDWVRVALLTLVGFAGKLLMDRSDTILVAPILGLEALAQYGAVTRLTVLIMFIPVVLLPIFAPQMSRAYAESNGEQMRRLLSIQLGLILLSLAPIVAVLVMFPEVVLRVRAETSHELRAIRLTRIMTAAA